MKKLIIFCCLAVFLIIAAFACSHLTSPSPVENTTMTLYDNQGNLIISVSKGPGEYDGSTGLTTIGIRIDGSDQIVTGEVALKQFADFTGQTGFIPSLPPKSMPVTNCAIPAIEAGQTWANIEVPVMVRIDNVAGQSVNVSIAVAGYKNSLDLKCGLGEISSVLAYHFNQKI